MMKDLPRSGQLKSGKRENKSGGGHQALAWSPLLAGFDARTLTRFRRRLLAWYRRNARPLPWRKTADPYAIWISEIMLQQTTVAAVIPYFERFLRRFPTVRALAEAREDEVLRHWEGLGYYSRARNLHNAARDIVQHRNGEFPDEVEELLELPGIGKYTAGAIASFAFDRPAPIVEANTLRLYCRLLGYRGDPRSAAGQRLLWEFAGSLVTRDSPGLFNQSLMELGARVCTPETPDCGRCPVESCCAARTEGSQAKIPAVARRPAPTPVTEIAVAVHRDGCFLMRKRAAGERWAGLWDFIRFGWDQGSLSPAAVSLALHEQYGFDVGDVRSIAEICHSVTRFRITLCCYAAEWVEGEIGELGSARWIRPGQWRRLPLSTTGRKLARLLENRAE